MRLMASPMATKAPVIDAVRVPPSAWITSQSRKMVRSPSFFHVGHGAKRAANQPLNLVRAPTRSAFRDSRGVRVRVERGSMPYSLVTQPLPRLRRNCGTESSMVAVQITRVLPVQ